MRGAPGVLIRTHRGFDIRTQMSYFGDVRGREFVKRVFEIGAERNVSVRIDTKRGKGVTPPCITAPERPSLKIAARSLPQVFCPL